MAKKIKTEIALGIIVIVAIAVSVSLYVSSRPESSTDGNILKKISTSSQNQGRDVKILFATNGQRKIYKIQRGGKWVVEIDGRESEAYDSVDNPTFSPDGAHFVYSATSAGRAFIVYDNEAWERYYNRILQILFSPDGGTLGYVAERDGASLVVLNDQESEAYPSLSAFETSGGSTYIIFSSDGQNVAYQVTGDEGSYIVVNGEAGETYDEILSFSFDQDGNYTYQAVDDGQVITVVNDQVVDSDSSGTSSTTASASQDSTSSSSNSSSTPGSSSSSSGTYFIKKQPDAHLDEDRLFYPNCTGSDCNF